MPREAEDMEDTSSPAATGWQLGVQQLKACSGVTLA